MIRYLQTDPWKIIESGFHPERQRSSESMFSIGNGRFGQRACHEESYSGSTLQGSYIAGVYYPDKTRVGWWKNGYPEYFAKVLNSTNWIGIKVFIDGEELDLHTAEVLDFHRELDMRRGLLIRRFSVRTKGQKEVRVESVRFCSMRDEDCAAIRYSVTPVGCEAEIRLEPYLEGDVCNHDSNYDEHFWLEVERKAEEGRGYVITRTKKTAFDLAVAMECTLSKPAPWTASDDFAFVRTSATLHAAADETIILTKYVGIVSSLNEANDQLRQTATDTARKAASTGFDALLTAHEEQWATIWSTADILIEGDDEAQQGIRFNIFHLNQTYTGTDSRLNIGPKGFTGEKYGGSTYWDTEAYCIPFYMATKPQNVARQLLVYRYHQLEKAIENATKLGFTDGAALFPMVTMNGEECHNEWEITFEEIHRNGAIAYAIWNYIRYTGDWNYLAEHGLDVLIGIARFWSQRVNFSEARQQYVMLGVTGPNEYENNVNNNWYTNYIARWCLIWCMEASERVRESDPARWKEKTAKWRFDPEKETERWKDIVARMYFPVLEGSNILLQQDGFLDKEQQMASDLSPAERPINQHWSWDRILRSVFIKQADVLQGLYFFEDDFSEETLRDNFNYYEPRTVHESSLSPCVHSILASRLGYHEKAYEMYMRTSRLDLDDYNHEAHEGLHITSMAGTWMSVVQGFGGMRVVEDKLVFTPSIPAGWKSFSFRVLFRGSTYTVVVNDLGTRVEVS